MTSPLRTTSFLLVALSASLTSLAGCSKKDANSAAGGPNVLLVTLDTVRCSRLSCYGHPVQTTPNLDALAADGIKFDTAISQAAVTPVSHASILTGLNPYTHGVRVMHAPSGYKLPESVPTLAAILKEYGWSTAAFLSAYPVSEHFGFDRGFDLYDNGLENPTSDTMKKDPGGKFYLWDVEANQRRSDKTTDRIIEWARKTDRPFFAWVHYWDPHDAFVLPPADILRKFASSPATKDEQRVQVYDADLYYTDQQFGRLIQTLKDNGQYDNTIIIVIADHGEGLADGRKNHGWFRHRLLYQEQIHVPFIMRVPEGPKGRIVPALVRSIDILPTVLDFLDITPPEQVEGTSLRGLIENKPEPPRLAYADALNLYDLNAHMVHQRPYDDLLHCIMDAEWKLIYRPTRPRRSELYNLKNDPHELDNLFKREPERAQQLLSQLNKADCFVNKPFEAQTVDAAAQQEVLDRLRSLGYVGFTSEKAEPGASGVVKYDEDRSCPGYNLYSNHQLSSAYLIDAEGNVVRHWAHEPSRHWANCDLLPNGDLLLAGSDPYQGDNRILRDSARYVMRLNWKGEVLWKRTLPAHHDIELTPRGQLATLTIRPRLCPAIDPKIKVRDEYLTLLSQDGTVLEEHSLYDVFSASPDLFTFQHVAPEKRQGEMAIDLMHFNSIEWMHHANLEAKDPIYAASNVLVCCRHQDTIAIINWDKKKLVWAWGQDDVSGPHHATVLKNGNILLFDNGLGRNWSRVIELDPLANRIVWEYKAPEPTDFYTITRGGNQRLPNGNTLISNSEKGQAFEVTPEGEIVWEFLSPHLNKDGNRGTIVRMTRYELSYVHEIQRQFGGN